MCYYIEKGHENTVGKMYVILFQYNMDTSLMLHPYLRHAGRVAMRVKGRGFSMGRIDEIRLRTYCDRNKEFYSSYFISNRFIGYTYSIPDFRFPPSCGGTQKLRPRYSFYAPGCIRFPGLEKLKTANKNLLQT